MRRYIIRIVYGIHTLTFGKVWYSLEMAGALDVLKSMRISGVIDDFEIKEVSSFENTY